jgi:hypothetical protein
MTYLQALRLMAKAYKAAKGVMPKGLDLLKLKMKARQKAIDSKKVIEFPKERITNPFKPRPRSESEAQMLARMKRQNKESVARLKEKKDLGDRLKDLPDDIPDMADGGVASAIKKIKKRFGKKSITTGDKIKRPGNRQLFDDFKKRNKFNVGGMANLSQTYDNNPTLQAQFPNKQDYLDLFGGIASTTVAQTTTPTMAEQATQSTAIKPIKPIIPIPESGDGGGPGPKGFDKGFSSANFGLGPNKDVVDYEAEAYGIGRTPLGTMSGIITSIPSLSKTAFQFVKSAKEKSQKALEDFFAAREAAKAAEVARIARQNLAASMGSDAGPGEGAGTFGASVNEATGARGPGTGFSDYS